MIGSDHESDEERANQKGFDVTNQKADSDKSSDSNIKPTTVAVDDNAVIFSNAQLRNLVGQSDSDAKLNAFSKQER